MRWGYKKARELVRRMGFYRGEFVPGHPVFPTDSAAVCQDVAGPWIFPLPISCTPLKIITRLTSSLATAVSDLPSEIIEHLFYSYLLSGNNIPRGKLLWVHQHYLSDIAAAARNMRNEETR